MWPHRRRQHKTEKYAIAHFNIGRCYDAAAAATNTHVRMHFGWPHSVKCKQKHAGNVNAIAKIFLAREPFEFQFGRTQNKHFLALFACIFVYINWMQLNDIVIMICKPESSYVCVMFWCVWDLLLFVLIGFLMTTLFTQICGSMGEIIDETDENANLFFWKLQPNENGK